MGNLRIKGEPWSRGTWIHGTLLKCSPQMGNLEIKGEPWSRGTWTHETHLRSCAML